MKPKHGNLRIGTSGFQYDHWQGIFYPKAIHKTDWFAYYCSQFDTVEINNTFYRLPEQDTVDVWRERAPKGFLYALKFSRYATHVKRLKDAHGPIERFLQRAARLRSVLGPILVQLPPRWKINLARLSEFLEAVSPEYRWVLEFRDPSWLCEESYAALHAYGAALCIHDMISNHPVRMTTNWVYLRFHGDRYRGSYSRQFLVAQARRIREYLLHGLDVYAYFNNDAEGYAIRNALDLRRYVGRA